MKKQILSLMLVLLLVGCNFSNTGEIDSFTVIPEVETTTPTIVSTDLGLTNHSLVSNTSISNIPPSLDEEEFKNEVYLKIPALDIDANLKMVCGDDENNYDFSAVVENPVWLCSDASEYLSDIGAYGASIILGHRQWGIVPKVFAEVDKLEKSDKVIVQGSTSKINFKVQEIVEVVPEEVWKEIAKYYVLGIENEKSFLILITCTPYGTDQLRLFIILEREYE